MALYNPKTIYDPATMPLVEGWEETNNCTFVRFHWVLTEADQKKVDTHWRPDFYRHSIINAKMACATHAGVGVPGWDPFLGKKRENPSGSATGDPLFGMTEARYHLYDQSLGTKLARGILVEPTGLAEDPRLPPREPAAPVDILQMLRNAAARYEDGVQAEHTKMLAEHAALKSGTWAQRAAAPKVAPTLADARRSYEARISGPKEVLPWWAPERAVVPGVWHEWEIVEVERERARQDAVERAWQRAEASYKAINPTWGGGT